MIECNRLDDLLGDRYSLVKFKDLSDPYKRAMAFYMGVDGEAWSEAFDGLDQEDMPRFDAGKDGADWHAFWNRMLIEYMPKFVELYGDVYFGVLEIDTGRLIDHLAASLAMQGDTRSAEEITAGARSTHDLPYHNHAQTDRWPVILSNYEDETMQDGFHRLGNYLRHGATEIPAIFYPQERHFEAKGIASPASDASLPAVGW